MRAVRIARSRSTVIVTAFCAALGLITTSVALAQPAPPSGPTEAQIVSGPGGALPSGAVTGFVTKVVPMVAGGTALYRNNDISGHNVTAVDLDANGQPLFSTETIGLLESTPVVGASDLAPGVYEFYCRPHPLMRGYLAVVEDAAGLTEPEPTPPPPPTPTPEPTPTPTPDPGPFPGDPAGEGDWPLFGHDLGNSRTTDQGPELTDLLTSTQAWGYTTAMSGDFAGTPIVANGSVYMASSQGRAVALDAETGTPTWEVELSTAEETAVVTATVAYHRGVVYVPVSATTGGDYTAYIVALRASDGVELWRTYVDPEQWGGDLYGSPVIWEGTTTDGSGAQQPFANLYIGTSSWDSGGSGREELHMGTVVALDLLNEGEVLWRTYMFEGGPHTKADIPIYPPTGKKFDGAAVWSTPTVDTEAGHVFVGTGNGYESRHALTGSIVKLDAFTGEMLDHYQATTSDSWQLTTPTNGVDADFGASPQLVEGPNGEQWVGGGQKNMHLIEEYAGTNQANTMAGLARYHMVDRETMESVWVTPVGPGYWWGGITGATAYDGERIYGSTVYGNLWALDAATGTPAWMVSSGDAGAHMAHTQVANGIVYSADGKGFVSAWDAATGAPLWSRPLVSPESVGPSAAGVAIVGDTIYTAMGFTDQPGGIFAFRP